MPRLNLTIHKVAHHRNGVHGNGFHVVSFTHPSGMPMVGIVFDEPASCAVLNVDLLAHGVVEFPDNAWRCEDFAPQLRTAVEKYEQSRS